MSGPKGLQVPTLEYVSYTWWGYGMTALSALSALTWWCRHMEMLSTLLALCDGNPPVTGGFPSQRTSNVELCCFHCWQTEQAVEQTVYFPVFWCLNGHVTSLICEEAAWCCDADLSCYIYNKDHFVYMPSQWETRLKCNVVSHWLGTLTKCSWLNS